MARTAQSVLMRGPTPTSIHLLTPQSNNESTNDNNKDARVTTRSTDQLLKLKPRLSDCKR